MRAIHYQVKGHPRSTLLTSLTDPKLYPGPRNWSSCTTSAGRPRSPTTRSRRTCSRGRRRFAVARPTVSGKSCGASLSPTTWCALKSNVQPQRRTCPRPESASSPPSPSCGNEIAWLYGRRLALGTIPSRLQHLRRNLKRLVLPPRRERTYPRAVKVKMSNYPRKRPTPRRPK